MTQGPTVDPLGVCIIEVPGWYEDTSRRRRSRGSRFVAPRSFHIDCDLYSSAACALRLVTPLLQDGTVIIFDDWYHFSGDPNRGEQRAFREWAVSLPTWEFSEYHKEGAFRNSFVASRRTTPRAG